MSLYASLSMSGGISIYFVSNAYKKKYQLHQKWTAVHT